MMHFKNVNDVKKKEATMLRDYEDSCSCRGVFYSHSAWTCTTMFYSLAGIKHTHKQNILFVDGEKGTCIQ